MQTRLRAGISDHLEQTCAAESGVAASAVLWRCQIADCLLTIACSNTKRQIDTAIWFGFCPSFVSLVGGSIKFKALGEDDRETVYFSKLTVPQREELDAGKTDIVIGGLTIGAILATAAHLEHSNATSLDFTGLSQKNGSVVTHIRVAPKAVPIVNNRIPDAGARSVPTRSVGREDSLLQFTLDNTQIISAANLTDELTQAFGEQNLARINATAICEKLFGNTCGLAFSLD